MSITVEDIINRWTNPSTRPKFAKGALCDEDGCHCAQGDILAIAGWDDERMRTDDAQSQADREVARLLGISLSESVLLRTVNDSSGGCPENVLRLCDDGIGRVLGPNWRVVVAFFHHIDTLSLEQWTKVDAARDAAGAAANAAWFAARDAAGAAADAAWFAAGAAARDAAGDAARDTAGDAAWDTAGDAAWDTAGDAAWECVGISHLKEPFFLKMFFDDVPAFVAKAQAMWPEGATK